MKTSTFVAAPLLAGMLMAAVPAHAQQDELTADAVKQFFSRVQEQAIEMMATGNFQRIAEWTEENISDSARFNVLIEVLRQNEPKMWTAIKVDKSDVQKMQSLLGHIAGDAIQDYSLAIEVDTITPHGPGAATATVIWSDSGSIMMPMPQGMASRGQTREQTQETVGQATTSGQPGTVTFRREFECNHLLVREDGQVKMGLTTCNGQTQF